MDDYQTRIKNPEVVCRIRETSLVQGGGLLKADLVDFARFCDNHCDATVTKQIRIVSCSFNMHVHGRNVFISFFLSLFFAFGLMLLASAVDVASTTAPCPGKDH